VSACVVCSGSIYVRAILCGVEFLAEAVIVHVICASCSSEFLELEAVPTASHLEGPLERGSIASSTLPEMNQEEPLERFFVCIRTLSMLLRVAWFCLDLGN
jgi:hypothetical protein